LESLEPRALLSGAAEFDIVNVNPADGSVVPTLPNGQVVVTLSEPVAGLSDGESPVQDGGTFNPYDVALIPRGPDGVFTAGDLPVHANVVYHENADGTSELVITPTGPLSSDVFLVQVDLAAFHDASGNTLVDGGEGYRTFLLQLPAVAPSEPLAVTGVTGHRAVGSGSYPIDGNVVNTPDTIQISFNKPLFAGAAGYGNVQLVANPGPNFSVVPSVAAYSPTGDSVYLTPTAPLSTTTVYAIRVAGQDSGSTYVSDDQGYGGPGYPLARTFYDTFMVDGPFLQTTGFGASVHPANGSLSSVPVPFVIVSLGDQLNAQSLDRNSVALIPRSGGVDGESFDAGDAPVNATVAFNPNNFRLVVVPTQPVAADTYVVALGPMSASNGTPLPNNDGQPAAVGGNPPYYATFTVTPPSST
jgi:hypothetical protein